jgi:hypothetical protein
MKELYHFEEKNKRVAIFHLTEKSFPLSQPTLIIGWRSDGFELFVVSIRGISRLVQGASIARWVNEWLVARQ